MLPGQDHLTQPYASSMATNIAATVEGQASWAQVGCGHTCRECAFWLVNRTKPQRTKWGELQPAACSKANAMLKRRKILRVPHNAVACKFFEAVGKPPKPNVNANDRGDY